MTAAHRTLPFGTRLRVCYSPGASGSAGAASAGRCVTVRINDRGPFVRKHGHYTRDIDLSDGACRAIGLHAAGVGDVDLEVAP